MLALGPDDPAVASGDGPSRWHRGPAGRTPGIREGGDSTAQVPATGGLSVGMGLLGARLVENWTVIVEPAATFVPVGDTEVTVSAGGGAVGVADAWVFMWSTARRPPAATTTTAAQTMRINQRRGIRRWHACSPGMSPAILLGSSRAYRSNSVPIALRMDKRRPWSVILVPSDSRT